MVGLTCHEIHITLVMDGVVVTHALQGKQDFDFFVEAFLLFLLLVEVLRRSRQWGVLVDVF